MEKKTAHNALASSVADQGRMVNVTTVHQKPCALTSSWYVGCYVFKYWLHLFEETLKVKILDHTCTSIEVIHCDPARCWRVTAEQETDNNEPYPHIDKFYIFIYIWFAWQSRSHNWTGPSCFQQCVEKPGGGQHYTTGHLKPSGLDSDNEACPEVSPFSVCVRLSPSLLVFSLSFFLIRASAHAHSHTPITSLLALCMQAMFSLRLQDWPLAVSCPGEMFTQTPQNMPLTFFEIEDKQECPSMRAIKTGTPIQDHHGNHLIMKLQEAVTSRGAWSLRGAFSAVYRCA